MSHYLIISVTPAKGSVLVFSISRRNSIPIAARVVVAVDAIGVANIVVGGSVYGAQFTSIIDKLFSTNLSLYFDLN